MKRVSDFLDRLDAKMEARGCALFDVWFAMNACGWIIIYKMVKALVG